MTDYTLPTAPFRPDWAEVIEYGQQCAEAARAPLLARIAEISGAMQADDERLSTAAARVGITAGCDAAEWMADEIERNRARIAELEVENRRMEAREAKAHEMAQHAMAQPVALQDGLAAAAKRYAELRDSVGSCSDGCCVVKRPTGMHTNGGCRCPDDRFKARKMMWAGQQLYEAIAASPAGEEVPRG